MAATPESRVKKLAVEQMRKLKDCYYFYPVTSGYGSSGVPDIVGCYKGMFFAFECKAGSNKPTALQELNMSKIRNAGGAALVVNESNVLFVKEFLEGLAQEEKTDDPA
jgi:hypothetical protein